MAAGCGEGRVGHARRGLLSGAGPSLWPPALIALAASVVVLVGPAVGPGPLVLSLGVEGPPVPGSRPGHRGTCRGEYPPAALPAQPVWVVLLPGPGVLALGVVVAAPLLIGAPLLRRWWWPNLARELGQGGCGAGAGLRRGRSDAGRSLPVGRFRRCCTSVLLRLSRARHWMSGPFGYGNVLGQPF